MSPLQYFQTGLSMVQSASEDRVTGGTFSFGVVRGMHINADSQGCMMLKKKKSRNTAWILRQHTPDEADS